MNNKLFNKPLSNATIGDIVEAVRLHLQSSNESDIEESHQADSSSKKHYVYGIAGLAQLLGCSTATAQRIKSRGILNDAISQSGKIIVIDADLALDILKVTNKKWGYKKP